MKKTEILNEIEATRYASRMALYGGEHIESAALDRVTDRLIAKAENELKIEWAEIKKALETAEEKARANK